MRNPGLIIALVLLALIPIVVWGLCVWATVLSYRFPASTWPSAGADFATIVLVLTPAFIGGILMIAGAVLLARRPLGARVAATIGLALMILTAAAFIAFEARAPGYEALIAAALFLLLHAGVVVWLWRSGRRPAV